MDNVAPRLCSRLITSAAGGFRKTMFIKWNKLVRKQQNKWCPFLFCSPFCKAMHTPIILPCSLSRDLEGLPCLWALWRRLRQLQPQHGAHLAVRLQGASTCWGINLSVIGFFFNPWLLKLWKVASSGTPGTPEWQPPAAASCCPGRGGSQAPAGGAGAPAALQHRPAPDRTRLLPQHRGQIPSRSREGSAAVPQRAPSPPPARRGQRAGGAVARPLPSERLWLGRSLLARRSDAPGFAARGGCSQDGGRAGGSARPGVCSWVEIPPPSPSSSPLHPRLRSGPGWAVHCDLPPCRPRCMHERRRRAGLCRRRHGGAAAAGEVSTQRCKRGAACRERRGATAASLCCAAELGLRVPAAPAAPPGAAGARRPERGGARGACPTLLPPGPLAVQKLRLLLLLPRFYEAPPECESASRINL